MRRSKLRLLTVAFIILGAALPTTATTDSISSADLPLEARDADSSSQEDELISSSYVLPNQIFNDGKPYYAGKDPISGLPDFSAKKPAGIETAANEVFDPKEKIVLSSSSPNIHDFLNLPVKYSSSKFVYPLVSSSYANLKYQGSNKNYMTNKKPSTVATAATPAPKYHSQSYSNNYYTVPTTKLMPVPPTAAGIYTTSTSTATKQPPTSSVATSKATTTTTTTVRPTTTTTTTKAPSSTAKYTTSTRKPTPSTTTTFAPRTTPTRKKFVPTKKYSPTTTAATASTPMRFPTERPLSSSAAPRPIDLTPPRYPTKPTPSSSNTQRLPSTNQPIVFTENPSAPPVPYPSSTPRVPNLDPADVYQTLGQKHTDQKFEQKPSMSLADIFNSLAEEESAVSAHNQGNHGIDAQGNLIQPISPSQPSPFAMQKARPQSTMRPTFGTTPMPMPLPQSQATQQQQYGQTDQKLISGSQENYSNEYVSYQVQQPNVMQYRPVPGAINNVVISPGQQSATFVLGSQQQVGSNAFGTIEKEPLFSKDPHVQYGTVINEDISSVKRPAVGVTQNNYPTAATAPTAYQQMPATQMNSNFHQNGNFAQAPSGPANQGTSMPGSYQEPPPAAPSPYQQLPLMSTKKRPNGQQKQQQQQQQHSLPQQQLQHKLQQQQQQQPQLQQQSQPPQQQTQYNFAQQQHKISLNMPSQQPQTVYEKQALRPQSSSQPSEPASINISNEQETQELLVSTNIRFPANDAQTDEYPVLGVPPAGPQVNGHAQPLSLQQIQQSNPVVFPKTNEDEQHGVTQPHEHPNDVQIQKHEVLTMNQHKQKLHFPPPGSASDQQPMPSPQITLQQIPSQHISAQHIPSQHMEPPPVPGSTSAAALEQQEAPKRPPPNRPHTGPQAPAYKFNEFTRKPIAGINRPNADRHLPNILPQFRPNAKLSSGHAATYNQEPGNIRIGANQSSKRPNVSPQFSHRHQPMPQAQQLQQQRYPMKRISEYPGAEANRRIYRLPSYGAQRPQYVDRMYSRRPPPPSDSYAVERHAVTSNTEPYKTLPQTMSLDKLAAFEEEDLVINDPPQPMAPSKAQIKLEEDKLEPVVTLQMLQSQKKSTSAATNDDSGAGEIQVPSAGDNELGVPPFQNVAAQNGLYVVYPMKADTHKTEASEAAASNPLPAFAHIESAPTTGSGEYQNTPFSVLRDQPQEPILMVKNKKPQSLQQQTKQALQQQVPKDKFPYPIEKPDPSYTELNMRSRVPGVLIAPRIINGAYTEAPIAIAYTPTEPNPYRHHAAYQQQQSQPQSNPPNKYSNVNLASSVISEIRHTDTQTEEGLNNDFDLRGQNYEKDFMAPFYPSVSLGSATNAPSNGWNILPSSTDSSVYEKNNINRADIGNAKNEEDNSLEATTKSFELDSFQPELQGGFKPIYPPGYKIEDEPEEVHLHEGINSPVALASRMEAPLTVTTTSSTTTTSTTTPRPTLSLAKHTTTTTETLGATESAVSTSAAPATSSAAPTNSKPTPKPKSTFETSLAALLFGDDEDFEQEDGEARKDSNVKAVSGPRSHVPRSGPRNLKLS